MYVETSHYVAQTGLELVILLPLIPECWDYREMPPPLERHVFIKEVIMHECVVGKNQLRAWAVVWGRQAESEYFIKRSQTTGMALYLGTFCKISCSIILFWCNG
jgi:hypothetical protein